MSANLFYVKGNIHIFPDIIQEISGHFWKMNNTNYFLVLNAMFFSFLETLSSFSQYRNFPSSYDNGQLFTAFLELGTAQLQLVYLLSWSIKNKCYSLSTAWTVHGKHIFPQYGNMAINCEGE